SRVEDGARPSPEPEDDGALVLPQDPDRGGDDEDHDHHDGNNADDQLKAAHTVPPRDARVVASTSRPEGRIFDIPRCSSSHTVGLPRSRWGECVTLPTNSLPCPRAPASHTTGPGGVRNRGEVPESSVNFAYGSGTRVDCHATSCQRSCALTYTARYRIRKRVSW